jgi:hypothetical protein
MAPDKDDMNGKTLKRYIYRSRLVAEVSCVSTIIQTARLFNAAHGITGVLIFDGERFVQYIEGPPDEMDCLITRLQNDPRHADFEPLGESWPHHTRLFDTWAMGYGFWEDDGENSLIALTPTNGFAGMMEILPSLDIV